MSIAVAKEVSDLEAKILRLREETQQVEDRIKEIQGWCCHFGKIDLGLAWAFCGSVYTNKFKCPDCLLEWSQDFPCNCKYCSHSLKS